MSGFGERFRRAGYSIPKPLIQVEGRPIIAHVIDLFPGERNFIFICNQEHLDNPKWEMKAVLKKYAPTGIIIGIAPHKLGPVHAVSQAEGLIDLQCSTIVNYCDFNCYWDWTLFKKNLSISDWAGVIVAYKGFHPHSLGETNYAYMRESKGLVEDIQEKKPFTNNRMEEFTSSGTYYFATGKIMLEAFKEIMEKKIHTKGEYYVSLAYRSLLEKKLPVAVYPIEHFMQWGTPEDLDEYKGWSKIFKDLLRPKEEVYKKMNGTTIIPMAGLGKRFSDKGYSVTKPLISVLGKPMVVQATNCLPNTRKKVFVVRKNISEYGRVIEELQTNYPDALIETIPGVTKGQACTAILGLEALEGFKGMITIGACDNGVLYGLKKFENLVHSPDVDVIVWAAVGHTNAIRNPQMFGWIKEKNGCISQISVKEPLNSPRTDPIVIGTFTFCQAEDFRRSAERLFRRSGRVGGEFYIDSCINDAIELGLNCRIFKVDSFISWGTPNDLKTFEYWQSCFHKWSGHPYRYD